MTSLLQCTLTLMINMEQLFPTIQTRAVKDGLPHQICCVTIHISAVCDFNDLLELFAKP